MAKTSLPSLPLMTIITTILVVLLKSETTVASGGGVRVVCGINGVCSRQWTDGPVPDTVCRGCKSCTFQNCCHKIFTDPRVHCPINGWHSADYVGNWRVERQTSQEERGRLRKRGTPCSTQHPCPKGQICDPYPQNYGTKLMAGECRDAPSKNHKNAWFALFVGIFVVAIFG